MSVPPADADAMTLRLSNVFHLIFLCELSVFAVLSFSLCNILYFFSEIQIQISSPYIVYPCFLSCHCEGGVTDCGYRVPQLRDDIFHSRRLTICVRHSPGSPRLTSSLPPSREAMEDRRDDKGNQLTIRNPYRGQGPTSSNQKLKTSSQTILRG